MINKTSAMVQAGILAAVAIIMALIALYVPVIGMFVNFIWPLPVIVCGYKHGLKYGIMTLIVSGIIIAMLASPVNAFFLVVIFGLLGLILGECMRRKMKPLTIMLYGSIGALIALILNLVLAFLILDIDPLSMLFTSFDESLGKAAEFYRSHGFTEEQIAQSTTSMKEMIGMIRIIMPGAFVTFAPIMAFVNYWAAKKVLARMGESFEGLPPFTQLKVPGWVIVPYALSLAGVTYFFQNNMQEHWGYKACVNIQTVCSLVLVFQAISLIYWYVESKKKPRWWADLGVAVLFFVPMFSMFAVYLGAFDTIFDYRNIRGYKYREKQITKEDNVNKKNKKR
ncbi:MAG: YybS family protein [Phascolarctobacterium sp.]|nr:YybS family protein [Phascolarctobacterium sp.]